jgi:hypothetical protein
MDNGNVMHTDNSSVSHSWAIFTLSAGDGGGTVRRVPTASSGEDWTQKKVYDRAS